MAAYIGYLLLAGIQIPFFKQRDSMNRRCFNTSGYLKLCCLELLLLAGFRGYTIGGADVTKYLSALDYYGGLPFQQLVTALLVYPYNFEIGYFALTKLCAFLRLGKTGFLFVIAALIYIPTFSMIKKYSPIPYISILCYFAFGFFAYSLSIFRQMIAGSILLCGWKLVMERRLGRYMLLVGLAMIFHTTAVAGILLYLLYGVNWKRIVIWLPVIEGGLLIWGRQIALLMTNIFSTYASYVGSKYDVQGGTYLMLIILNVVLLASTLLQNEKNAEFENITICALILAICVQSLGYSMGVLGRATRYFSIYMILAIPNVLINFGKKISYKWGLVITMVTEISLFALTWMELRGDTYLVPYKVFFS